MGDRVAGFPAGQKLPGHFFGHSVAVICNLTEKDIMVLIEGTDEELRRYEEKLGDVSTDLALKYLRVFSIIDVKYQEYMEWRTISPFYKNVDKEGVVVYAA